MFSAMTHKLIQKLTAHIMTYDLKVCLDLNDGTMRTSSTGPAAAHKQIYIYIHTHTQIYINVYIFIYIYVYLLA